MLNGEVNPIELVLYQPYPFTKCSNVFPSLSQNLNFMINDFHDIEGITRCYC